MVPSETHLRLWYGPYGVSGSLQPVRPVQALKVIDKILKINSKANREPVERSQLWVNVVSSVETSKKLHSEVAGGGRMTFWFCKWFKLHCGLQRFHKGDGGWGTIPLSLFFPPLSLVLLSYSCIVGMHS